MWLNGECYIIGGGPSILDVFGIPKGLVQSVLNKKNPPSVYSDYLKSLHDKHVIGINCAFLLGDWVDVCFFGDSGFYRRNRDRLAEFPKLKVSCAGFFNDKEPNFESIKYIRKHPSKQTGLCVEPSKLVWNYHSGGAAIDLAVHFGAKIIYLIGFDMKNGSAGDSHWHGEYIKEPKKPKNIRAKPPYYKHLRSYPAILKNARQMDIHIFTTNPNSAIPDIKVVEHPWNK